MAASYKDRVVMVGDSESTSICELTGMAPGTGEIQAVSFFSAGENEP